jgi:Nitrile hydratase beta subunit
VPCNRRSGVGLNDIALPASALAPMRRKPTARFGSNAKRKDTSMKLQHYIGGLENVGPVLFERKVFVEPWETRSSVSMSP